MSGEVVALPRRHRSAIRCELAEQLRTAAEMWDRLGLRGRASRYRREAARLEHDAAACEAPAARARA